METASAVDKSPFFDYTLRDTQNTTIRSTSSIMFCKSSLSIYQLHVSMKGTPSDSFIFMSLERLSFSISTEIGSTSVGGSGGSGLDSSLFTGWRFTGVSIRIGD